MEICTSTFMIEFCICVMPFPPNASRRLLSVAATLLARYSIFSRGSSRCSLLGYRLFRSVTMDVIASTFFGTKIDSQNNPNDQFTKHASKAFDFSAFNPAIIIVCKLRLNLKLFSNQSHPKCLRLMLCLLQFYFLGPCHWPRNSESSLSTSRFSTFSSKTPRKLSRWGSNPMW